MENAEIAGIIIGSLGIVAWFLIRNWLKNWESRLIAQDMRLDKHEERHNLHDVNHATISNELQNIRKKTDEIGTDVKELLRQNGNRSSA